MVGVQTHIIFKNRLLYCAFSTVFVKFPVLFTPIDSRRTAMFFLWHDFTGRFHRFLSIISEKSFGDESRRSSALISSRSEEEEEEEVEFEQNRFRENAAFAKCRKFAKFFV
jgi:hypothetical protein